MVGQDVRISLVEVSTFDPVCRADWVERHCYLVVQIRIQFVQITTKTVVQNVDVFGKKFRRFLAPYPDQFPVLEGDRLHLFTLSLILDTAKNDSVSGDLTFQRKRIQIHFPEAVSIGAEHSVYCRL